MIAVVGALALLVATVAGGLALSSHSEALIASAHRRSVQLGYVAETAAERVVNHLEHTADWRTVPGSLVMGVPQTAPDTAARTTAMNRTLSARFPLGADTPRWRVVAGAAEAGHQWVAWLADDPADGDNDPDLDGNGRLVVRAEATSPSGARRTVDVHLARSGNVVRRLSWREVW